MFTYATLAKFGRLPLLWLLIVLAAAAQADAMAPTGLMTDLLRQPETTRLDTANPGFTWIVPETHQGDHQTAYQILVASSPARLNPRQADEWNSGKMPSSQSIHVQYAGAPLKPHHTYYWQVRTWNDRGEPSGFSKPQTFKTADDLNGLAVPQEPVVVQPVKPQQVTAPSQGRAFIDFGQDAYAWLELTVQVQKPTTITVCFGEKARGQTVDRHPGGVIRYAETTVQLKAGRHTYPIHMSKNRKTYGGTVVMPFRYVEIDDTPVPITSAMVRQMTVHVPFDDTASRFESSNETLNAVWGLCKHSIKATSAFGIYIDGDRERKPYEADAYIDQLGHYNTDRSFATARRTGQYLLKHPTWPTEWKFHSIFIAHADYMYTGKTDLLARDYDILQSKLLQKYARPDGLLDTHKLHDIVDWPRSQRDGYVFEHVNTVVNAFYYRSLLDMADIAQALGKTDDAKRYRYQAAQLKKVFNKKLFDPRTGLYVDGLGTHHSTIHANFFPLAFGLVPEGRQKHIVQFLASQGMKCSVYGAQYLLTALYRAHAGDVALSLLTSHKENSWYHMLKQGATITTEAWDPSDKSNLDWNHAWGSAPANIIPRFLLGVRPLTPGYGEALIQPEPGNLEHASAQVPTIRGPIRLSFENHPGQSFKLSVTIPANMTARVGLPTLGQSNNTVKVDGHPTLATRENNTLYLTIPSGSHNLIRTLESQAP